MMMHDFECQACGRGFEAIVDRGEPSPACRECGAESVRKLVSAPGFRMARDEATARIEKRVKDYLKDGKVSDAMRFADRAASLATSDKVKQIADRLHQKTGR